MDLLELQRQREEVLYLHSLWHQGPSNPRSSHPPPSSSTVLMPPPQNSGKDWPCQAYHDPSPTETDSWPSFTKTESNAEPEKPDWFIAQQSQFNAMISVENFFKSKDSDSDSDTDDWSDEDEETENENVVTPTSFFLKLFEEDKELREFYKRDYENGLFTCLVCHGMGWSKRFKDCTALVRHTLSMTKAKKKEAHRAYGQAVCNLLGWEISNLSSIVSGIREKRNLLSKANKGEEQTQETKNEEICSENGDNAAKDTKEENVAEKLPSNCGSEVSEGVQIGAKEETKVVLATKEACKEEENEKINAVIEELKESDFPNLDEK